MIEFTCQGCQSVFRVSQTKAGGKGKCPKCGQEFVVPSPAGPSQPAVRVSLPPGDDGLVRYVCGSCGRALTSASALAGQTHHCPACGSAVTVPFASQSVWGMRVRRTWRWVKVAAAAVASAIAAWVRKRREHKQAKQAAHVAEESQPPPRAEDEPDASTLPVVQRVLVTPVDRAPGGGLARTGETALAEAAAEVVREAAGLLRASSGAVAQQGPHGMAGPGPGRAVFAGGGETFNASVPDYRVLWRGRPSFLLLLKRILWTAALVLLWGTICLYPVSREAWNDRASWAMGMIDFFLDYRGLVLVIVLLYLAIRLGWRTIQLKRTLYTVTTDRIEVKTGIISRNMDNVDMFRVQDVKLRQSILERILGIGTVLVITNDPVQDLPHLGGIGRPKKVYEILKEAMFHSDKRRAVIHTS